MAPLQGQVEDNVIKAATLVPYLSTSSTNTVREVYAPRHWQDFAFMRNAARVEFGDGSVAFDVHLDGLRNVRELEFRQCDFLEAPHALAHCRVLRFVSCDNLHDLSGLASVEHLDIAGSRLVAHIDALPAVRSIVTGSSFKSALPSSAAVTSVTAPAAAVPWCDLRSLTDLHLKQCHALPATIPFQVDSVFLSSCEQLESVACFRRAAHVELVRTRLLAVDAFHGFSLLRSIRLQASTCLHDLSALRHVHEVSLSLCVNLQDISPLAEANTVEISCCPQIHAVAALAHVPTLSLSRCADLVDLTGLTHNTVVRISECYRVEQVAMLGHHCHTVDISRCYRVTDAALLATGHVHTVSLNGCNVSEAAAGAAWRDHPTLHTLDLSNNWDVVDAAAFAHLHTVYLERTNVRDVAPLANVHTLSLAGCDGVHDVHALATVHTLDLSHCMGVRDVAALAFVRTLNLAGTLVEAVAALATVYELNLSGCACVSDDQVNQLTHVHTLVLMGCAQLTRVDGLRFVHALNLANCIGLTDVTMLGHVHTLDLTGCINVRP
ncbi:Aste57867_14418 [Aphanomyces stellatus]|uniref:Aste57867_14418 protein n=1 Tax=Aphanomyces stellatus TaxID=120398 RepID=A0A485L0K1_9STRA|nr:hypothetical protein As57867_014364 [Aphanomyces stellatus]VFT91240.1 Aste57867_14418 [Aphanomyces stellatus]